MTDTAQFLTKPLDRTIFLYRADARLSKQALAALIDNGFIPIKVKSLDSVRVMPSALPPLVGSDQATAALLDSVGANTHTAGDFGRRLIAKLRGKEIIP